MFGIHIANVCGYKILYFWTNLQKHHMLVFTKNSHLKVLLVYRYTTVKLKQQCPLPTCTKPSLHYHGSTTVMHRPSFLLRRYCGIIILWHICNTKLLLSVLWAIPGNITSSLPGVVYECVVRVNNAIGNEEWCFHGIELTRKLSYIFLQYC